MSKFKVCTWSKEDFKGGLSVALGNFCFFLVCQGETGTTSGGVNAVCELPPTMFVTPREKSQLSIISCQEKTNKEDCPLEIFSCALAVRG